jgi:hypothetical protein
MKKNLFFLIMVLVTSSVYSQNKIDSLAGEVSSLAKQISAIKNLKISGYVQAHFQLADSAGIASFSGGNFPTGSDKRFTVRRARLKFDHSTFTETGELKSQLIMQLDFSEKGFQIRDAYIHLSDPWTHWIGIRAGIADKPFGYELVYSSSTRETHERGRMSQVLFPQEKDLGVSLWLEAPKSSRFNWLRLQVGLYNGTGIMSDVDLKKDLIGQLTFRKSNANETVKISGGLSYYNGGVKYTNKNGYAMHDIKNGNSTFLGMQKDTSNIRIATNKFALREYFGMDLQATLDHSFGITTLRAEYIQGHHPGQSTNFAAPFTQYNATFTNATIPAVGVDLYNRTFTGMYFYWVQNILHSKHSFVVKYDMFDPNTKVSGTGVVDQVVKLDASGNAVLDAAGKKIYTKTGLGVADIAYNTLSIGYIYRIDEHFTINPHVDLVKNEITAVKNYNKDLKDNVYTLRLIYKF